MKLQLTLLSLSLAAISGINTASAESCEKFLSCRDQDATEYQVRYQWGKTRMGDCHRGISQGEIKVVKSSKASDAAGSRTTITQTTLSSDHLSIDAGDLMIRVRTESDPSYNPSLFKAFGTIVKRGIPMAIFCQMDSQTRKSGFGQLNW